MLMAIPFMKDPKIVAGATMRKKGDSIVECQKVLGERIKVTEIDYIDGQPT